LGGKYILFSLIDQWEVACPLWVKGGGGGELTRKTYLIPEGGRVQGGGVDWGVHKGVLGDREERKVENVSTRDECRGISKKRRFTPEGKKGGRWGERRGMRGGKENG